MATYRKLASGRVKAQVFLGNARFTSRTFDTKRLAESWARSVETDRDRGVRPATPSTLTVRSYYAPLAVQRAAVLSAATADKNASHWSKHLEPIFGERRLVDVRRSDISGWVATASKDGVGAPTIKGCIQLLSAIFESAVGDDLIPANPASRVRLPRHSARVVRWIEPAEVDRIVAELAEPYALLVEVAANTGLRWAEVAGLKVEAVDPFGRSITVRSVLTRRGIRDYPKNDSSRRVVPVPDDLRPRLLAQMTGKRPGDLMFAGPRGGGLSDRNVNERHLTPACERAGVERLTFHMLRHAYCSWMVAGGMPLTEVASLVGHSSTRMLEQRYAHLQPGVHDRARDTLAAMRAARSSINRQA